jgi:hypothetical protein
MSTYDGIHDDEPVDVTAVALDDELIENLRRSLSPESAVVWDDDEDDLDPGYALLRAVQLDVSADLPLDAPIVPDGVIELAPRRRTLGRGATIAAVTAGVVCLGGVAAAAPGRPLSGVGSAVSSAVHNVVDAITPDSPVGPAATEPSDDASPSSSASPTPRPTPPGDAVSAAARSASAIEQITANLDRAAALIHAGRMQAAAQQLDAAERKLAYVSDTASHDALAARLADLRARLGATPKPSPSHGQPADKGHGKGNTGQSGSGGGSDSRNTDPRRPTALPTRSSGHTTSVHVHPVQPSTPVTKGGAGHHDE